MNSRQLTRLARQFGVRAKRIIQVKSGVYHLVTPAGSHYCLKKMRYAPSRLRWMDRVLRRLRKRGFPAIAWRNPRGAAGHPLFALPTPRSSPFILTPWIVGKQPSPASKADLKACAQALATFHIAGRKAASPAAGAYCVLGKWPSKLRSHEAFLQRQIRRARQNRLAMPLNKVLQKYGPELLDRAERAMGLLKGSDYKSLCRKAAANGTLCHGDSGPKNFVITSQGVYLIDFETLRIDLPVYDLYRMIRLSCKNKGWQFDTARAILDGYESVSKLRRADYDMLKAWLLFPHKAVKLLRHCSRLGEAGQRRIAQTLRSVIADERKLAPLLDKLDSYAKKDR
ncbi:hypothetical protein SD70_09940 [Gordoniibacillus kamchatkensis]|uniref:Aminoglycoside phosphotransferase domain-containing protein n=1 Tax=Gordoniibacillus kamchatkensis TaxID=1590651 RepID=A0ABR5AIR5_9BACL|nr:phosphotransferase [Paenibacillus sp. VKM B-2647]KIL40950.1 hypothetical protein SD70_09940 [Paenibacillus sp. VKM B-2647]